MKEATMGNAPIKQAAHTKAEALAPIVAISTIIPPYCNWLAAPSTKRVRPGSSPGGGIIRFSSGSSLAG